MVSRLRPQLPAAEGKTTWPVCGLDLKPYAAG
jgi:hypothetical protein